MGFFGHPLDKPTARHPQKALNANASSIRGRHLALCSLALSRGNLPRRRFGLLLSRLWCISCKVHLSLEPSRVVLSLMQIRQWIRTGIAKQGLQQLSLPEALNPKPAVHRSDS